jgi:hypothetical protein
MLLAFLGMLPLLLCAASAEVVLQHPMSAAMFLIVIYWLSRNPLNARLRSIRKVSSRR